MKKLAIVGSGIAGLGCLHFLKNHFEITVLEQANYLGGHTNTVEASERTRNIPIDTGFMVYNETTYPNLTHLFKELNVPTQNTDMSFSVRHEMDNVEWCGSGLNHLFAQRRNIINPRFWKMMLSLDRFNKQAEIALESGAFGNMTIADYTRAGNYGDDFFNWFLVPMSSAIWSTTPEKMLQFPARTLLQFFRTHGFLGMKDHLQWRTVTGGAREYVRRLTNGMDDASGSSTRLLKSAPVTKVVRHAAPQTGVTVHLKDGTALDFDRVILACHADQALQCLDNPTPEETSVLSNFKYEQNQATLHTDIAVMPKRKLCWASWNYNVYADTATGQRKASTHYWMNNLQGLDTKTPYFVSINAENKVDPAHVIKEIAYTHPIFSLPVIETQKGALPALNRQPQQAGERQRVFFCGSYFKYGFHEDALTSALDLSRILLGETIWPQ